MTDTVARVLFDSNGNAIKVTQDGSDYKYEFLGKLRNIAGTIVNPATEDTLTAADTKLGTIDGVLDSIKDTDGIKKITDELPAGTQEIGLVGQGTKAAGSDAWTTVLYTASGEAIKIYTGGGYSTLAAESMINVMLLQDIRTELRRMNAQLQMITDIEIDNVDLEQGGEVP
jgi:hypothetical protein